MPVERPNAATLKGNPLTLVGPELKVGDAAPGFTAVGPDLKDKKIDDFAGRITVLSSVPSLDTPVCDMQTRRFNEEAGKLGGKVRIVTISADLPFAQKRWCGAAGADKIEVVSDYRDMDFGSRYGVLIKGLRLDHRAVFVIDDKGRLGFVQYVKEMAEHPDYDSVLKYVKTASSGSGDKASSSSSGDKSPSPSSGDKSRV